MIAFEVFLNGKKACTAGAGDGEVYSSLMLTLRKRNAQQTGEGEAELFEDLRFHVGAIVDMPDDTSKHLGWLTQSATVGDEITIHVIETEAVDKPSRESSL